MITLTGGEHLQPILSFKQISSMSEHGAMVTHELVLVAGRRLLHRWVVSLSLHVCHGVGQVLEKLGLRLEELQHSGIHLYLLGCPSWMIHCRLIDS
jgi:hypothetical protein